jgi:hypothetical protein
MAKRLAKSSANGIVDNDDHVYSFPLNDGLAMLKRNMKPSNNLTPANIARDKPTSWLVVQLSANNVYNISTVEMAELPDAPRVLLVERVGGGPEELVVHDP